MKSCGRSSGVMSPSVEDSSPSLAIRRAMGRARRFPIPISSNRASLEGSFNRSSSVATVQSGTSASLIDSTSSA